MRRPSYRQDFLPGWDVLYDRCTLIESIPVLVSQRITGVIKTTTVSIPYFLDRLTVRAENLCLDGPG
jgi:hypothetical protein